MSVVTEAGVAAPTVSHVPWWRGKLVQVGGIVALMWLAYRGWGGEYPWPDSLVWNKLQVELDEIQTWLIDRRLEGGGGIVFTIFVAFRVFADNLVTWINDLLVWLTWIGTTVAGTLLAWRFGGVRAGAWALAAFASFAISGLWEESMQTLALMLAAVGMSLVIGGPLGVAGGRSPRFHRALTPFLDAAQIVPAFAYLMPVVVFFSIGYAAAVVATMIYAVPPCIRITALGIRRVPVNTVEAAVSMGSTRRQMLAGSSSPAPGSWIPPRRAPGAAPPAGSGPASRASRPRKSSSRCRSRPPRSRNEDFGPTAVKRHDGDRTLITFDCANPDFAVSRILASKGAIQVTRGDRLRARIAAELDVIATRYGAAPVGEGELDA